MIAAGTLALAALTGCSGTTVSLDPAPGANDPACAEVTVRLPAVLSGEDRRSTNAQATGAWGAPASVILRCGVTEPDPTTLPCQTFEGVDWVIDDADAPRYRATTFNRSPAVDVYLDGEVVPAADVLQILSGIVSRLPANGSECTNRVG